MKTEVQTANPIEDAVAPLKAFAMDRAEAAARKRVEKLANALALADWDINAVAPYPKSNMSTGEYRSKERFYKFAGMLVTTDESRPTTGWGGRPRYVVMNAQAIEKFAAEVREMAAEHYAAYVAKLVHKIGPTTEATLTFCHHDVWDDSTLTVTTVGGATERWNTKVILNHSVHGTPFNQWPTRKLKATR
jgi:hypothetical protein